METSFTSAVVILLLVTDPIGNIPLFVSLLRHVDPERRVRVIVLRMIFHGPEGIFGETASGEPFIVPLAIPSIAGPAAIATVVLLVSREPQRVPEWLLAVTVAVAACLVDLVFAERISRWVGEGVLAAFERLMGLLLTAIAVEMLLHGIEGFVRQLQSG